MSAAAYLTVAGAAQARIEVSRSVFLARIERVETEEDARAVVAAARREHWDARHHCSAFRIGPTAEVQRSSDDGEPAGTAGAPILQALAGQQVSDAVVVVTRWFGGVLLGTGGLVRAYGDATRAALAAAVLVRRTQRLATDVRLDPATAGRVEHALRAAGFDMGGTTYQAGAAQLAVHCRPDQLDELTARVAALTSGTAALTQLGTVWVDEPAG